MMEPALAAVETVAAGPRSGFLSTSWSDEEAPSSTWLSLFGEVNP
jgi:hypothetical protein